jgi:hypothetical protein
VTDDTANMVLEIPKRLQAEFGLMRDDMRGMRSETTTIKQHMAAFMSHEIAQDGESASIRDRLDRIERRLELRD